MIAKVIEFSFESGTLLGVYGPKKSPDLNRGLRYILIAGFIWQQRHWPFWSIYFSG
jgi:hypothetical protein